MSALVTAIRIKNEVGIEPFLHVCARDRNLIGLQSDMLGAASADINNVLYITGDPPKLGKYPFASAVFDADAIGMVQMQARLNRGIDLGGDAIPTPTRCVIGVGADPNALDLHRELSRFQEKVEAGADVVITQPVFDTDALLRFIDEIDSDYHIPVIAGVWPLASLNNAKFMKTEVPGVHVPDWIIDKMSQYEKKEDQRKAGIEIARKSLEKIKSVLAGVQVSAPFGNVNTAIAVINK
jgi:homocysteine S-methyltransferase